MNEGMTFQFPSLGIRHPEVINYRALGTAGRGIWLWQIVFLQSRNNEVLLHPPLSSERHGFFLNELSAAITCITHRRNRNLTAEYLETNLFRDRKV